MTGAIERTWCGRFQYPGREPFMLGTISINDKAPTHEVERALLAELCRVLPPSATMPATVELLPGEIVFLPEPTPKGTDR
ncbi:MAG: hypothetical protein WC829_04335 [Hyphomicrobium sp.]|jgi:hypothetical protein